MKEILRVIPNDSGGAPLRFEGEEFIVRRVEGELATRVEGIRGEADAFEKNTSLPTWVQVLRSVFLCIGAILISVGASTLSDVVYGEAVGRGLWWYLGAGGALIAGCGLLWLYGRLRRNTALAGPEQTELKRRTERLVKECAEALAVPSDAAEIDVFLSAPQMMFRRRVGIARMVYAVFAYRDGDALCLCDRERVFRIPFDRIEEVALYPKRLGFYGWNKPEPFNKGRYRPFKIRTSSDGGLLSVKSAYLIRIRGSEPFALLFPPYEFETLAPLLGSKAYTCTEIGKLPK